MTELTCQRVEQDRRAYLAHEANEDLARGGRGPALRVEGGVAAEAPGRARRKAEAAQGVGDGKPVSALDEVKVMADIGDRTTGPSPHPSRSRRAMICSRA
jgi:hypothetical protein